jgi:hypothetical protein
MNFNENNQYQPLKTGELPDAVFPAPLGDKTNYRMQIPKRWNIYDNHIEMNRNP